MADPGPPDDLVTPPPDLIGGGPTPPPSTALGAFGRGMVRGVLPATGGMAGFGAGAEAGASLGELGGPLAGITVPAGVLIGGLGGAYLGASGAQNVQDWALSKLPPNARAALGQSPEQAAADVAAHPYASFLGELAPNLAFMQPGTIPKLVEEGAPLYRRLLAHPVTARAVPATIMGGTEAATEHAQGQPVDPLKVAAAAGLGAAMNRETALGRTVMGGAATPVRAAIDTLTDISAARPVGTTAAQRAAYASPPVQPPADLTGATLAPVAAPQPGEPLGLKFPNAPPRRATVDQYFDNGNAVRLRFDDGKTADYLTSDVLRDRTEPPPPMGEPPEPVYRGPALTEAERMSVPFEEETTMPMRPMRPAQAPLLGPQALNALDQAHGLERLALNPASTLSAAVRQDMLAEAASLRRQYGFDERGQAAPYRHPLANEPAADIGELAGARVRRPELYEGEYQRPPTAPRPQPAVEAPPLDLRQPERPPAAPVRPRDLLQFLADKGGLKAEDPYAAGNLQAVGADRWHLGKAFQRRLVQPPGSGEGLSLDYAREAAQQAGYGADYNNFETVPDLMQAIDEAVNNGRHTFAEPDRALADEWQAHADAARAEDEARYGRPEDYEPLEDTAIPEYEPGADYGADNEVAADQLEREMDDALALSDPYAYAMMQWRNEHAFGRENEPEPGAAGAAEAGSREAGLEPGGAGESPPDDLVAGAHPDLAQEAPAAEPGAEGRGLTVEPGAEGLPQTVIPGTEQSVRQFAAAREAQGHGRKTARSEQKAPGGLFAEPERDDQGTLFQTGEARGVAGRPQGERVKLADDLIGRTLGDVTPGEAKLLNAVEAEAGRIVPTAKVAAYRRLEMGREFRRQTGSAPLGTVTGATYSNGARRLIAWSLESPDAIGTLRHEGLHYLYGRGLITKREWGALNGAADKGDWEGAHDIASRYPDAPPAVRREEAIAEQISKWRRAPDSVPAMFRPMYERIARFIAKVADHMRRIAGADPTANDATSRILSGEVGARQRLPAEPQAARAQASRIPDNMDQAGDRLDAVSDVMADNLKATAPGTYSRTLDRLNAAKSQFKSPGAMEKVWVFPHTMAKLDTYSARLWDAYKAKDAAANTMMAEARSRIANTFLKLNETQRRNVYAAEELDRINSYPREDDGRSVVARNEGVDTAHFSKPGDVVKLSPEESAAYHERRDMFRYQWDRIMEGAARRMGWAGEWGPDMDANLRAVNEAARESSDAGGRKVAQRAAEVLNAMAAQRRDAYVPLMRFGDYYVSVTPKRGAGADEGSLGGFPQTAWFELVERPPLADWMGERLTQGQVPSYAQDRIDALTQRFPPDQFNIEHGHLFRNPEALRRLDIPAVEKLLTLTESGALRGLYEQERTSGRSKPEAREVARAEYDKLYGQMIEQLRTEMYEQLKAGFKKRSRTVPGYSPDFDRTTGAYMSWSGHHVAEQLHGEAMDQAYENIQTHHPNAATKQYWKDWRDYMERPTSPLGRAANLASRAGFLYTLAGNVSSAVVNATDPFVSSLPTLANGIGMKRASRAFATAAKDAIKGLRADGSRGLYIEPAAAGKTPDETALLDTLNREGQLHALWVHDMEALNARHAELWGAVKSGARKMLDIASSTMGATEQAKRVSLTLATHRLMQDPATLAAMDKAWGGNQVWKATKARHGLNPEAAARFMLSEGAFEWGKANQAAMMRGPLGQATFLLHGFQTRFLSQAWNLMHNLGPDGRRAALWAMAGVWALSGTQGLPFAQDAENLADHAWKFATGRDPMLADRLRALLADSGLGKVGAEMVMRGPASAVLGVDLSDRIGFGDILSREFSDQTTTGLPLTVWSIFAQRAMAMRKEMASGQTEKAFSELLPGALRNPIIADAAAAHGVRSQTGKSVYLPARKVTPAMQAERSLGFMPLEESRARQAAEWAYRAKHAKGPVPKNAVPKPEE